MATAAAQECVRDESTFPSLSVSDARKRFEVMSGNTNNIHGPRPPRQLPDDKSMTSSLVTPTAQSSAQSTKGKTGNPGNPSEEAKETGTSNRTKKSNKTHKSSSILSSKSFSSLSKKKKKSPIMSDHKGVSKTDSDPAIAIDSKKISFSKSKSDKKRSKSPDSPDSQTPAHSSPDKTSPSHKETVAPDKKRREAPKPPSQQASLESKSPPQSPVKESVSDKSNNTDVKRKPSDGSDNEVTPQSPVKTVSSGAGGGPDQGAKKKPARPSSPPRMKDGDINLSIAGGLFMLYCMSRPLFSCILIKGNSVIVNGFTMYLVTYVQW